MYKDYNIVKLSLLFVLASFFLIYVVYFSFIEEDSSEVIDASSYTWVSQDIFSGETNNYEEINDASLSSLDDSHEDYSSNEESDILENESDTENNDLDGESDDKSDSFSEIESNKNEFETNQEESLSSMDTKYFISKWIQRQHLSYIATSYYIDIMWWWDEIFNENCDFKDWDSIQDDFYEKVIEWCEIGLLRWAWNYFYPHWVVWENELATVIIRMMDKSKREEWINILYFWEKDLEINAKNLIKDNAQYGFKLVDIGEYQWNSSIAVFQIINQQLESYIIVYN